METSETLRCMGPPRSLNERVKGISISGWLERRGRTCMSAYVRERAMPFFDDWTSRLSTSLYHLVFESPRSMIVLLLLPIILLRRLTWFIIHQLFGRILRQSEG